MQQPSYAFKRYCTASHPPSIPSLNNGFSDMNINTKVDSQALKNTPSITTMLSPCFRLDPWQRL